MKQRIINIALAVLIVIIGGCLFLVNSKSRQFVFIDVKKTIKEFNLTKEYDIKLQQTDHKRKQLLDSMQFDAEMASRQLLNDSTNGKLREFFFIKRDGFLTRQEQFQQDQQTQMEEYNAQVLKQINQYALEFRKEKNYPIMFGASGNGSIMSADDAYDVTDEFLAYVNSHYHGTK
ncbi:MAG: OmpH family outer membrane protein [Bacteroidota bacterium]|nr:OmpH family outer membrane protein [Bacteroidota bacterium]